MLKTTKIKIISIILVITSVFLVISNVGIACPDNINNDITNSTTADSTNKSVTIFNEESASEEITSETTTEKTIVEITEKEVTTEKKIETTTKKQENTTKKPESTTKKVETTTKKPETTTKAVTNSLIPKTPNPSSKEKEAFDLLNAYRRENGLNELKWDKQLHHVAEIRAKECAILWTPTHERPDGTMFWDILIDNNYKYSYASENLCKHSLSVATPEKMMQTLKNSSSHNKAMLDARATKIGLAYYESAETGCGYLVQIFAG